MTEDATAPETGTADGPAPGAGSAPPHDRPVRRVLGGRKVAAWIALISLVLLVARVAVVIVQDFVEMIGLLVDLGLLAIGIWWSVTGRRVKRHLGYLLAGVAAASVVVAVIGFALNRPRAVFSIVGFGVLFGYFSARALDLGPAYKRWRENRVALPAAAAKPSVPLRQVTIPCGLIVNEKSGGGKAEQIELAHHAKRMGIHVKVLHKGDDLVELAEGLVRGGAEALGMAGGDGSLGLVASIAAKHDVPFVCIPVGTRNHFARDLGLDRSSPLDALAAFYGHEVQVDMGDINDRLFLNNASFGVYADLVHEPGYRDAKIETGQNLVSEILSGGREPSPLEFNGPGGESFRSAFMILVAVGAYEMGSFSEMGVRASLESGELQITVLEPADEKQLRRITTAAVLGTLGAQDGFWQWPAASFEVACPSRGQIYAGVDGEALTFDSPVRITIKPKALRVLVPETVMPVPGRQTQPLSATITDLLRLAVAADS
ncbi:MAG: hypothetical protein HYX32_04075 [Actinobacteria bacterium]|nr:hypothetical protein [Actinomycetota bacterium]